jgi:GNAT superfamily N-acetyltransferase
MVPGVQVAPIDLPRREGDRERFLVGGWMAIFPSRFARTRSTKLSPTASRRKDPRTPRYSRVEEFSFPLTMVKSVRFLSHLMSLHVQLATPTDLPAVLSLMREMQNADPWTEPFVESVVSSNLQELLADPAFGLLYLVWEADCPVAYLVICFDYSLEYRGKGAWIDELFVQGSHRGQGIGTQLLELAERASAEHRTQFLHLEVTHGNPAIELYRRRGFVDHHRYLMSKRLPSA